MFTLRIQFDNNDNKCILEKMSAFRVRVGLLYKLYDIEEAIIYGISHNNTGFINVFVDGDKAALLSDNTPPGNIPTSEVLLKALIEVMSHDNHVIKQEILYTSEDCGSFVLRKNTEKKIGQYYLI